jgi:16S rRNA (cytosine1402-N4)-methyltransferase
MRFDKTKGKSAYDIVNFYEKEKLIKIFKEYGEENMARRIAEKIETERKKKKITTTKELSSLIESIK